MIPSHAPATETRSHLSRLANSAAFGVALCIAIALASTPPAKAASLAETFSKHDTASEQTIDHAAWTDLLAEYVVPGDDGLNRVSYGAFKSGGHDKLKSYITSLTRIDISKFDRPEQFAYWANLYNAKTIDIILDHYPVDSIKDISLGGSLTALVTGGPWKAKVVTVKGRELSLDDIEHNILRKLFPNPARVHYAVNCASVGCPNLNVKAYTGANLDTELDQAARAYVNSPRGVQVSGGKVTASSIYNWFGEDFGGTDKKILDHLRRHADDELKSSLAAVSGISDYEYNWQLNDAK